MSLAQRLADERRARLAAERLLEQKQRELAAEKDRWGHKARRMVAEIRAAREENLKIVSQNRRFHSEAMSHAQRADDAENRLWNSIGAVRDGFAFFSSGGRLIAANPAYLSVFVDPAIIKPGMHYEEIVDHVIASDIMDFEGEDPVVVRQRFVERWQSSDPENVTIRLSNGRFIKLVLQDGQRGERVSLVLDVTEPMMHEAELKQALDAANAASQAKSAFLANMSHEIRTPMNGLVGMADLLMETELTEEQHLFASTIKSSGEALMSVINDVLDYSKLGADEMELRAKPFDLERCIHEVIAMLQIPAREKGLELLVDYDLFLPTEFVGDPARVRQVLTKLIENAIKFTREGHVLVRVVGVLINEGAEAVLHVNVQDTGIGISEDRIGHIFDEFTQADDAQSREYDGTGLGLAITQRLIHRMGGEIWVDSVQGEGTSFGFRLALAVHENCEQIPTPLPKHVEHVLVASDVSINGDLLKKQLQQLGAAVTVSAKPDQIFKSAARMDLIVIDHGPGMIEPLALARELQAMAIVVPVIVLSGDEATLSAAKALPVVKAVVRKPISRNGLCQTIESAAGTPLPATSRESNNSARQMRILSAEDNSTNRLVLQKMLKPLDIELAFAQNGVEAVELYQSFAPDLVLMDISMPKMDGKEATLRIRRLETDERTPIVAVTALASESDESEILDAGLDRYLTKPVRKAEIFAVISAHMPEKVRNPFGEDGERLQVSG